MSSQVVGLVEQAIELAIDPAGQSSVRLANRNGLRRRSAALETICLFAGKFGRPQ